VLWLCCVFVLLFLIFAPPPPPPPSPLLPPPPPRPSFPPGLLPLSISLEHGITPEKCTADFSAYNVVRSARHCVRRSAVASRVISPIPGSCSPQGDTRAAVVKRLRSYRAAACNTAGSLLRRRLRRRCLFARHCRRGCGCVPLTASHLARWPHVRRPHPSPPSASPFPPPPSPLLPLFILLPLSYTRTTCPPQLLHGPCHWQRQLADAAAPQLRR
jgi:hypothetical protein